MPTAMLQTKESSLPSGMKTETRYKTSEANDRIASAAATIPN